MAVAALVGVKLGSAVGEGKAGLGGVVGVWVGTGRVAVLRAVSGKLVGMSSPDREASVGLLLTELQPTSRRKEKNRISKRINTFNNYCLIPVNI